MRLFVFALHDTAVKAYGQPFFMPSEAAAVRAFRSLVNDPKSQLNQSPGDFSLHFLGTFDDTHGTFTTDKTRQIATGLSVYVRMDGVRPTPAELNGGATVEEIRKAFTQ